MRRRLLTAAIAAALASAGAPAVAQPAPAAAAAAADWTRTIARTPEGGMRMGNPDAPVRLVEYASITCPHCADFAAARGGALARNYVRGGQVSWEYRPFLIFPSDGAIVQLLMCGDDQGFFERVDRLYATQAQWSERLQRLSEQEADALDAQVGRNHSLAIIRATGLDRFFRDSGLDDAAIDACLSDEATLGRLWQHNDEAMQRDGVQGTPTFLINGEMQDAFDWDGLQHALRSALEPDT